MNNVKKIDNSLFYLGKNIIKLLDEKPHFLESEKIIIENQPALKNPTMKSIQMILFSYFLMKDEIKKIQSDFKETYKRNKYLAIKYTDIMIRENDKIDKKYHKLYDISKKKDDLSDAYLQGIYFINTLK